MAQFVVAPDPTFPQDIPGFMRSGDFATLRVVTATATQYVATMLVANPYAATGGPAQVEVSLQFKGVGMVFDGAVPIGGTITEVLRLQTGAGEPFLFLDGIGIAGATLGALIRARDEAGIAALILYGDDTITGSFNSIAVHPSGDLLQGYAGDDAIYGREGLDTLLGGEGHDRILAGTGDDLGFGEAGDDTLFGEAGQDTLDGAAGADAIAGGTGHDSLLGGIGNDALVGEAGNDTLLGEAGDDRLTGGVEDDWLDGGEGQDTLVGDSGNDTMLGGAGADLLFADTGADRLDGGPGNDTLDGGNDADLLADAAGDNELRGGEGLDTLIGGAGQDTLMGGGNPDVMAGGAGSDVYYADDAADVIYENPGEGIDEVRASASVYLYAGIENLTLIAATGNSFGVGNALDNVLTGNEGENLLIAGAGADTAYGGLGNDVLYGEDGADRLFGGGDTDYLIGGGGADSADGGSGSDALYGEAGNDSLVGGEGFFTDILIAGEGADTLDGDSGLADYDLMDGGAGDDTYVVDTSADLTFEAPGGGSDLVLADIPGGGYYLYANTEALVLLGTTAYGVGNEQANLLVGNAGGNYLLGGAGDDTLDAKAGDDVLFGEAGADVFEFQRGSGGDLIADFSRGTDRIQLVDFAAASFAAVRAASFDNGGIAVINLGDGDFVMLRGSPRPSWPRRISSSAEAPGGLRGRPVAPQATFLPRCGNIASLAASSMSALKACLSFSARARAAAGRALTRSRWRFTFG
ncbi:calcium-binding protein [Paeniroseomonas aquatica]|uniref:calcium-binding protein n=1 Tax=Paeniroseomonas aquatica TaxID=373043 RepID=UPI00361A9B80